VKTIGEFPLKRESHPKHENSWGVSLKSAKLLVKLKLTIKQQLRITARFARLDSWTILTDGHITWLQGPVNCYNGKFQSCFGVSEFLKFLLTSVSSVISRRALRMTAPGVSRVSSVLRASSEFQEVSRVSCEFQAFQEIALETLETRNNFKSFKSSFKSYF